MKYFKWLPICMANGFSGTKIAERGFETTSKFIKDAVMQNGCEAFFVLESGLASPEEIDKSCTRGLNFPLGPLAAADAFGLDILLACMQTFHREWGDKYKPCPLLVKLVKAGNLGRKTGKGLYDYG